MLKHLSKLFSLMVMWVLALGGAQAQDAAVKGKVTDESGEAIPGVSVTVKGTQRGTITNVDGTYSVNTAGKAT